jgi:hypothetical protein
MTFTTRRLCKVQPLCHANVTACDVAGYGCSLPYIFSIKGSNSSIGIIFSSAAPSSLCLTKWLGQGAIGEAWKGVVSLTLEPGVVLDVAAKVGWFEDALDCLLHEAKIYTLLRKREVGGVPIIVGLFNDIDDGVPILVTTYAGEEISDLNDSLW